MSNRIKDTSNYENDILNTPTSSTPTPTSANLQPSASYSSLPAENTDNVGNKPQDANNDNDDVGIVMMPKNGRIDG